jgi:hypothetical protein
MAMSLADLLAPHVRESGGLMERAVFGTADPNTIAAIITTTAQTILGGSTVTSCLFYTASSGSVCGLRLDDGRAVVLKAHQRHWELPFLRGCQRVQHALAVGGFPCPAPLGDPAALDAGWATLETFLPDPGALAPPDDTLLPSSCAGLARVITSCRDVSAEGLDQHPFRIARGARYPTPHNPIFDFEGTHDGAEWIDAWADEASVRRSADTSATVIAHMDWSARNVRLGPEGVRAVYDWDSLGLATEATVTGQSAVTWRSTGDTADVAAPGVSEILRFIAETESLRGAPFSPEEHVAARAAAVGVMAYAARCEHALEVRTPWRVDRARRWLRSEAAALLA